jgi:hypothetical protein
METLQTTKSKNKLKRVVSIGVSAKGGFNTTYKRQFYNYMVCIANAEDWGVCRRGKKWFQSDHYELGEGYRILASVADCDTRDGDPYELIKFSLRGFRDKLFIINMRTGEVIKEMVERERSRPRFGFWRSTI